MIDSVKHRVPSTDITLVAKVIAVLTLTTVWPASSQEADLEFESSTGIQGGVDLAPPVPLFPGSSQQEGVSPSSRSAVVPQGAIAVRELDALTSDSIGLLDEFSGGLPVDIWAGTPKELVDLLLPKLPRRMSSVAGRDLVQRLLLSVARPPEPAPTQDVFVDMTAIVPSAIGFTPEDDEGVSSSESVPDEPQTGSQALLESRLLQLADMGDWESVGALIEIVPQPSVTDLIRVVATDLALVNGRDDQVCLDVAENLKFSASPYWQKVFAFCQLRDGNVASAFLTIDLLRETGVDDAGFFWVAELMSGNRPLTPSGLDRLTPLQLAMLRSAGRPFPSQLVRDGDPTLLRMLATAPPLYVAAEDEAEDVLTERIRAATDVRLEAAERAVSLGSLDPDVLRSLYRAEAVDDEQDVEDTGIGLDTPGIAPELTDEEDLDPVLDLSSIPVATPLDRAQLFLLAEAQSIPTARAEVVSRAIDFARNNRGRNGPDVATMGKVYAPLIRDIVPTGDLVWFAGNAARALIAAGDLIAANDWLDLTDSYARTSIEAAEVAAAMWPTERQLRPTMTNRFTPLRFKRWEESRPPGLVAGDKALILSTLTALGEPVATEDWMSLMDRRASRSVDLPTPQIWNGLTLAAQNGRLGETILFALIALDEAGSSGVSPVVLSHVVSSLMTVGLEQEARRFAVEAALIQGL